MKILSIVTLDRDGGHPHDDPSIPARMGQLIAEMRSKGALVDTGGRDTEVLGDGTCYLHEVSPTL